MKTDGAVASFSSPKMKDLCMGNNSGVPIAKHPYAQTSLQTAAGQQPSFLYASLCTVLRQLS